jgi:hypothetical protein
MAKRIEGEGDVSGDHKKYFFVSLLFHVIASPRYEGVAISLDYFGQY